MQAFLTAAILTLLKGLTSGEFMDHVVALVRSVSNLSISGDQKKAEVKAELVLLQGDASKILTDLSTSWVNLAIEVAVAYVKAHQAS